MKKVDENEYIEMTVPELIKDLTLFVVKCVIVAIFVAYFVGFAYVPSSSMDTTLKKGDLCFIVRVPGELKRGGIYVFESNEDDSMMVKRLIGKGGDKIRIEEGKVYVNDELLEEDYLYEDMIPLAKKEYEVPEGYLFFLGDNRNSSYDSRCWSDPYISEDAIKAKMILRVWPLNRFGFV